MSATSRNKPAGQDRLSQLTIAQHQRPDRSGRGRGPLLLLVGAIVVCAVGAAWLYYRATGGSLIAALRTPAVDVRLFTVPREAQRSAGATRPVDFVASGRIVSDLQVKIATKVSGQITELFVEQGDLVEAGQVLAHVEDDVFRAQRDETAAQVERNRHDLARSEAERDRARGRVAEMQANHAFEKRNYERLLPLHENGQVGDFELLSALNRFEAAAAAEQQAVAAVASAEAAVRIAAAELDSAEAGLTLRQKRLDDCAIRAPISGVVLERNAQVGDFLAAEGGRGANANAQLVEIADMTQLRVEIDISEKDVHRIRKDQRVRIIPDAARDAVRDGYVMWVDPVGDYARAVVQTKLRIIDPGPDYRIGGSARAEFLAAESDRPVQDDASQAIWLPRSAVRADLQGDGGVVFTVVDGRAVANRVVIGARTIDDIEIRSGVYGGMEIVEDGLDDLEDGTPVNMRSESTSSP